MTQNLKFRQRFNRTLLIGALGMTSISMYGCDSFYWDEASTIEKVRNKSEIIVLTTQSPLIYSKAKRGEAFGIEHDLIQSFARHYGLKVSFKVLPNEDAVLRALSLGQGDFAAARLRTTSRNSGFLTGPAYEETHLSLYCHKKAKIQHIKDLAGKRVTLLKKDNYLGLSQRLQQLSPRVHFQIKANTKTQTLMSDLAQRQSDCVIAENFSGDFYVRYHRQLEKITPLTDSYSLSWLLTPNNRDLLKLMQIWFQRASRDDEILQVTDRYKTYLNQLDRQDITRFFRMIQTTLPSYKSSFRHAADSHRLPWELVASVAYQESHWNPAARSYTGVRGLMQLTTETALYLGVEDRTDPDQSIWGGSKYLRFLMDQTPKDLNSKDRLALTLAAYNVGLAHLQDAQKLAVKMGKNPHSWKQLKEVLPLLADPEYAAELKYGPARGHETVDFVERVKSFYNLMNVAG